MAGDAVSITCNYCHGVRLVGWSGAGPILCPECSRGQDAFTVITQAWREQRAKVLQLEDELVRECARLKKLLDMCASTHDHNVLLKTERDRLRKLFDDAGQGEHNVLALVDHYQAASMASDAKLDAVRSLLSENGCNCECGHHWEEHDDDCERCLACRIDAAIMEGEPRA